MGTYTGSDKRLQYLFQNGGGGGTTVIANPSGEATDDLEKIQIENTIYNIAGGGGGIAEVIDYDNVIFTESYTTSSAPYDYTYTATKDCFCFYSIVGGANQDTYAQILDGSTPITYASAIYNGTLLQQTFWNYLPKGKTLKVHSTFRGAQLSIKVFGVKGHIIEIANCYSTEERQVGCWTDGKPLYQKTIYIPSVTSGSSYNHGISDVENIFIHDIKAKRNTGWFSSGHAFENSPANITESFSIIPSATVLYAYLYGCTISECSVTVRYTKTTDTAGSGIWTPSGSYAHHYSTAEKVIGTWTDGSTLYEKTQEGGITFSAINTWYDTNITGVNKVISVNGSITRDGEPIPIGYFTSAINSTWLLRNNTIKLMMGAKQSGEAYALNSVTVRYTKTI